MKSINRTLILINPKQPYIDWVMKIGMEPKGATVEMHCNEGGAYLYDDFKPKEFESIVEQNYIEYFEAELRGYAMDREKWPEDLSLIKFHEWFKITYHSVLIDKSKSPIEYEEI